MEFIRSSGSADNRRAQTHQADFPDFVGNFALGVGQVGKQHVVVDIHAGDSGITEKLHRTGAKVIALDLREALNTTPVNGQRTDRWMNPAIDATGLKLPVEPLSADMVFLDLVLQHMRTPFQAIMQIKRILKPGGRLVITDIGKCADGQSREDRRDRFPGVYPGDIRHWLKSAGFSNIIVNPVPTRPAGQGSAGPDIKRSTGYLMATATA